MPSLSKAQQRLMGMAEHNPSAVSAENRGVLKMTHSQLHDFASGSMAKKPEHVPAPKAAKVAGHPHRNLGHYLHAKKSR